MLSELKKAISTANSALKSALFVILALVLVSCSAKYRNLFFDIPPAEPKKTYATAEIEEPVAQATATSPSAAQPGVLAAPNPADLEVNRPPIEDTLDWDSALEMLPKDAKGKPDWSEALRNETIKPRALKPGDRNAEFFKLDFFLKAKNPKYDVFFPHSSHVAWMGCESCHPAIFEYRDNEISMKAVRKGEYCGVCHGSVAFSAKNCKRCHLSK